MTIVGEGACFAGMAPRAMDRALFAEIQKYVAGSSTPTAAWTIALRLDAFLDLTGRRLNLDDLGSNEWVETWNCFAGALASSSFVSKFTYPTYNLSRRMLRSWGDEESFREMNFPSNGMLSCENVLAAKASFESITLDPERVRFWQGWTARNKKDQCINLRLFPLHDRLGPIFCNDFFEACQTYTIGRHITRLSCVGELADYVARYPQSIHASDFAEPRFVEEFITQFMIWYFRSGVAKGAKVSYLYDSWSNFVHLLEEQVLDTKWALPFRAVPRPEFKRATGATTHTRKSKNGTDVKFKLLTEVPLKVTDREAIEILFREIRRDVDLITSAARHEVQGAWARHTARKELAKTGTVTTVGPCGSNSGKAERLSRENPDYLSHAAATFESRGHVAVVRKTSPAPQQFYPKPLGLMAWELGLPTPKIACAFATLLVSKHPELTPSCLSGLDLFDSNGHRVGFQERDGGCYLRGFKRRKGAERALQVVKLDEETTELVRKLIEMTEPLREYLRAIGDPSWQRLFLTVTTMGSKPRVSGIDDQTHIKAEIAQSLQEATSISLEESEELANRFTIQRLRASAGVIVYLETQSVEKMAKALGHTRYSPALLDRYLPRVLQRFFVERWVRLFQTGILCECLKGTVHVCAATGLSPDDLAEFLENHALKRPLEKTSAADEKSQDLESGQVIFCISLETVSALLTLQRSVVAAAAGAVSGFAQRWFLIAEKLLPALEVDDLFRPIVVEARAIAQVQK